ncbi:hypothetical protein HZH68_004341 [Vespula germanica]|uniref:Uncharacterized protein n=1 Tax=Vespula germanica TaxID=30212 RepID=A0A834KNN8_VESGE|nr:hypothetical protein HZH68_004341 [Vespula germanica]
MNRASETDREIGVNRKGSNYFKNDRVSRLSSGVAARRDVEGNRRRKPLQEASAGSGLRKDSVNKSPVIRKNVPTVRNCRWAGGDRPVHFLRYASVKIF